jgi:hypothetical protein
VLSSSSGTLGWRVQLSDGVARSGIARRYWSARSGTSTTGRRDGGVEVINREALVDRFGDWPSFHDAEVYGLRLDSGQRTNGLMSPQLDVHVFAVEGRLSGGRLNFVTTRS